MSTAVEIALAMPAVVSLALLAYWLYVPEPPDPGPT